MKTILVTGGNGQLGRCFRDIALDQDEYHFIFVDVEELDITKKDQILNYFTKNSISYCLNCAAYTAVDKAESDPLLASAINEKGAENLAIVCNEFDATLIHISTDFVFSGNKNCPYVESDEPDPINVYGQTKWKGEQAVISNVSNHLIIRTSWLYSEYGHNFLKTMLRLATHNPHVAVVNDQKGTPTYARDLAKCIFRIVSEKNQNFGVYHYSNEGEATWFDFAQEIFVVANKAINLRPITSEDYPTPAKRPKYSVLDKSKIKNTFKIDIPYWGEALKECLSRLGQQV